MKCLIADLTVSFQSILQLLSSLEDYDVLVSQVPTWQRRLSSLLGDMKIVFDQDSPSVSVTEYLSYLYRIVASVQRELLGSVDMSTCFQPREFKDFAIRILRYSYNSLSQFVTWWQV